MPLRIVFILVMISFNASWVTNAQADNPSTAIQTAPPGDLQLIEALAQHDVFTGTQVRWGGTLLTVSNRADGIRLEILERTLNAEGVPAGRASQGRFLVKLGHTVDLKRYSRGQLITVSGTLLGHENTAIGNQTVSVPILVDSVHILWGHEYRLAHKTRTQTRQPAASYHDTHIGNAYPHAHRYPGGVSYNGVYYGHNGIIISGRYHLGPYYHRYPYYRH